MNDIGQTYAMPNQRSIIRYLSSRGWRTRQSRDRGITKIYLPPGEGSQNSSELEIFFTEGATGDQLQAEIHAALTTVSQFYEMSPLSVSQAVSAIPFDLILGRIPDEYVRNESVELRVANKYLQGMRDLLAASATTELSQASSFKRVLKEGIEYAAKCRFAHTYKGSFGFVIESPVGMNEHPSLLETEEQTPFERKVVERIIRGLRSYQRAITEDSPSPIASAESGFSANMCDEVVAIIEETDVSKIDLSIQLSPEWKTHILEAPVANFSIERRYVDFFREAAARLRSEEEPKQETVIGRIIRLEAEGNPSLFDDTSEREIVVSWDSSEYGLIKVQVPLTPADYLKAVEAHKGGEIVSLTGLLVRRGKTWKLSEPAPIRTLR